MIHPLNIERSSLFPSAQSRLQSHFDILSSVHYKEIFTISIEYDNKTIYCEKIVMIGEQIGIYLTIFHSIDSKDDTIFKT
jgi:hypothetical protein